MPTFMPGLELCRRFYSELVRPILDRHFPNLPHAAALIGDGSEVLGFDTEMSMDHNWFPRVIVFLNATDFDKAAHIKDSLSRELPHDFLGFPVDSVPVENEPGTRWMQRKATGPVDHGVVCVTLKEFIRRHMNWDVTQPFTAADWLSISSQVLRSMTAGEVYFDNVGDLARLRGLLSYYPHEVWLYLLASGWDRIGQEGHLMPRAGFVGDELGSAVMGARLVRDAMSLCFLMEKQYAPYPKWFGTAFKRLSCAEEMSPLLWAVTRAETWQARMDAMCAVYELLARIHNALMITEPLPEQVRPFHGRPFNVIPDEAFSEAILARITDPEVKRIAEKGLIGSLDQFSDNTILRSDVSWRASIRMVFANKSNAAIVVP